MRGCCENLPLRQPGESRDLIPTGFAEAKSDCGFRRNDGALMVRPRPAEFDKKKVVAENRRARFDYSIEDKYEAGIALTRTQEKVLLLREGSIAASYSEVEEGEGL